MSGMQTTIGGCARRCDKCRYRRLCGSCKQECGVFNCWDECAWCTWTCCQDRRDYGLYDSVDVKGSMKVGWDAFVGMDFPLVIPQVNGKVNGMVLPVYSVSVKMLVTKRGFRKARKTVRELMRIPEESRVILSFTAKDAILEQLWSQYSREEWIEEIAALGFDYAFGVNYSQYEDMSRMMQVINAARSMESIGRLQEAGLKVVPQIDWANEREKERWIDWIWRNSCAIVCTNFQMIEGRREGSDNVGHSWEYYVEEMVQFVLQLPVFTRVILQGVSVPHRLARLMRRFGERVMVVTAVPWCIATYGLEFNEEWKRKRVTPRVDTVELFVRNYERFIFESERLARVEGNIRVPERRQGKGVFVADVEEDMEGQQYLWEDSDDRKEGCSVERIASC